MCTLVFTDHASAHVRLAAGAGPLGLGGGPRPATESTALSRVFLAPAPRTSTEEKSASLRKHRAVRHDPMKDPMKGGDAH